MQNDIYYKCFFSTFFHSTQRLIHFSQGFYIHSFKLEQSTESMYRRIMIRNVQTYYNTKRTDVLWNETYCNTKLKFQNKKRLIESIYQTPIFKIEIQFNIEGEKYPKICIELDELFNFMVCHTILQNHAQQFCVDNNSIENNSNVSKTKSSNECFHL